MNTSAVILPAAALLAIATFCSCKTIYGQTDGFPDKLKAGCKTEASCKALVVEAEARTQKCRNNTMGYIQCDDAGADLHVAQSYLEPYKDAEKKREDAAKAEAERQDAQRRVRDNEEYHERLKEQREETARLEALKKKRVTAQETIKKAERSKEKAKLCDASQDARKARKRHQEITPTAPFEVKKNCKIGPKPGPEGVVCPAGFDPEVRAIGMWKLGIDYKDPFYEDQLIGVGDDQCADIAATLEKAKEAEAFLATPEGSGLPQ
jgi:hypothetical protein